MSNKFDYMSEQNISKAVVNAMMQALNESLKTDSNLAAELLQFMSDRKIAIPELEKKAMGTKLVMSYNQEKTDDQINRLKHSFKDIDLKENIL